MNAASPPKWLVLYGAVVCAFIALPLTVVILASFSELSYVTFPPQGFTFEWYGEVLQRDEFIDSFIVSVQIAVASAVVVGVLGTLAALGIARHDFRGRDAIRGLLLSPLLLPHLVFALALLQFYAMLRLTPGLVTLAAGHIVVTMPYVVRMVILSAAQADPNLELAGQTLGATPRQAFWKITLPAIRPAIFVGIAFAFIMSFDEVAVSLLNSAPGVVTLPIRIYNYVEFRFDSFITAVGVITMIVAAIVILAIEKAFGLGKLFGVNER